MIVRRFLPEDRQSVIDLLRAAFDGWQGELSDAYWEWKFDRNPHGEAAIWVGEDEGTIAGCYIWNPVRLRAGTSTIAAAQSVDAGVHPDYQGQGLFTKLARAAIEDETVPFSLVYAFPTEAAFRGQTRVGFEPVFAVPRAFRLLITPPLRSPRGRGLELREITRFESEFDALTPSFEPRETAVDIDAAYLEWRYMQHPAQTYSVLACEREGELCGYCITTVDTEPERLPRGTIVDLRVHPDAEEAASLLLHHALRDLRASGARVARCWMQPPSVEQQTLERFGFSTRWDSLHTRFTRPPYRERFIVFDREQTARDAASSGAGPFSSWRIVPGDADFV